MRRRTCLIAAPLALLRPPAFAQAPDFWALLREGGVAVLIRHAQTEPGLGDPPGFRLGQCQTQRKLSAEGRAQAKRLGEAFRRAGVRVDEVRSSAWCRCVDTAQLAFGQATVWPAINSFFRDNGGDAQTAEVLQALQGLQRPRNWVLVTHQVNIPALTGEVPSMGEVLLARTQPGQTRLQVLARHAFH